MEGKNTKFKQKKTIFNDPVYGFIQFPHAFLYTLIDHPYFQRLRRIKQLGLTDFVYPGAVHTRFNHSLGALHLTTLAIDTLRSKGVRISEEESEAVCLAVLLHDIGHGPFSHTLEKMIIPFGHEVISLHVMQFFNQFFPGKLDLAIRIFTNAYERPFFHELVAGQLDMDRLDFLHRDSFYTGVVEGKIGYGRLINMLDVRDEHLVVEEKGLFTIEQFLMARRMMYWQVYLHKTAVAAEKMLQSVMKYIHRHSINKFRTFLPENLFMLMESWQALKDQDAIPEDCLHRFMQMDDLDVLCLLKNLAGSGLQVPGLLAKGIMERRLFRIIESNHRFSKNMKGELQQQIMEHFKLQDAAVIRYLCINASESNTTYRTGEREIRILTRDNKVKLLGSFKEFFTHSRNTKKHFLIFPKEIAHNQLILKA